MRLRKLSARLSLLISVAAIICSATSCDAGSELIHDALSQLPSGESPSGVVHRPPRPTGQIATGPAILVSSRIVDSSGGSVRVQKPGDPLDGLELNIPAGAYADARQVNISYAPVTNHTFGDNFQPATPLITIETGGTYSDKLMSLRIPVDIPADDYAMAFYYDESTGTLEGIPFISIEQDSITIATRHFSTLLVSIISNTVLDDLLKGDIDSGFRPGADDWQFVNRGSYIAPSGHCAGQSVSAMWYFCEKPDGPDPFLWELYDRNGKEPATPDLWDDDSYGYRLASVIQQDIDWDNFGVQFQMELRGKDDLAHYKAFAYAITLTGEPQYVGIASNAGGGHAMIVYRVYKNNLYIADPNYPGDLQRRIELVNGQFKPYNSGANADEIAAGHGKAYESIGYRAKSAMVDWQQIGRRWAEFKAGTIGDDLFPQCEVMVVDDEGHQTPLADGYESPTKGIQIRINSMAKIGTKVFVNGTRAKADAQGKYMLEDGNNTLGVDIWGDVSGDPAQPNYKYINFKYFDVTYGQPECYGWRLESVTPAVTRSDGGDPRYANGFTFDVSDGSYASEGNMVIPMLEEDAVAHFKHTGTWSPLPHCLQPDESVTVTISASSALEITPPVDWGNVYNYLAVSVDVPQNELGRISLESRFGAVAPMTTREMELNLGDGWEGLSHDVIVQFNTESGYGEYRYTYVYHE